MSDWPLREKLQQGIDAARAGHNNEARQALLQVVERDQHNELAWLWLSSLTDQRWERFIYLNKVLAIDPYNAYASAGLRCIQEHACEPSTELLCCPRCEAGVPLLGTVCPECNQALFVACPSCDLRVDVQETLCPGCGQVLGDFRQGARYHLDVARAYLAHQRIDRANEAIARAVTDFPDDPLVLETVAELGAGIVDGHWIAAADARAIEQTPDSPERYLSMAAIYQQQSRLAGTPDLLRRAALLPGENSVTRSGPAQPALSDVSAVATESAIDQNAANPPARDGDRRRRGQLWLALSVQLVLLLCVAGLFARYIYQPVPLPELLPIPVELTYAPHYLFSIYGTESPVGVAVSPQGDRIYVAESGGERLVRIFDRSGNPVSSAAPPRTNPGERSPVYLATDRAGRVFVTDRLQHAVVIYDRDGTYLDTILGPDLTLSEFVAGHDGGFERGLVFAYNRFEPEVYYSREGTAGQTMPAPGLSNWSPLGLRIDKTGRALLTDILPGGHAVRVIPASFIDSASWHDFDPPPNLFGETGQGNGQLLFPNTAVSDSRGSVYVTDGNNGRIAVWDSESNFLFNFGHGTGEGSLSLPRGAAIDARNRLHVVDAVAQTVKVYDVSGPAPTYLFAFGEGGLGDGQFNYPNDIALDSGGRMYIADRENDRIQVWSY